MPGILDEMGHHRTLSNYLESLILKDVKAKGGKPLKAPDRRGRGKEGLT